MCVCVSLSLRARVCAMNVTRLPGYLLSNEAWDASGEYVGIFALEGRAIRAISGFPEITNCILVQPSRVARVPRSCRHSLEPPRLRR